MKLLQLGTNGVEEVDVAVGGGGSTAFVSTPLIAASNGQSNFVVSYTPNYTLVFLNGASITEYTQTSGTNIVLDAAVAAKIVIGDELLVVAFNTLAIGVASDSDKLDGFDSSYFATVSALASAIAALPIELEQVIVVPWVAGTPQTVNHTLGVVPKTVIFEAVMKVAVNGASIGDIIGPLCPSQTGSGAWNCEYRKPTTTNFQLVIGTNGLLTFGSAAGAAASYLTPAQADLRMRVLA